MENEITNALVSTNSVGIVAHRPHVWLPIHFGPSVSVLYLYIYLNIAMLIVVGFFNYLPPLTRERSLRRAFFTAIVAFSCVLTWSCFLVIRNIHYYKRHFVPPSPLWEGLPQEVLRQMLTWYIIPALVLGLIGLCVLAWRWRNSKRTMQDANHCLNRTVDPGGSTSG